MAQSFFLREQADRCRRLARATSDSVTQERLFKLAGEYDAQADTQDTADQQAPAARQPGVKTMPARFRLSGANCGFRRLSDK